MFVRGVVVYLRRQRVLRNTEGLDIKLSPISLRKGGGFVFLLWELKIMRNKLSSTIFPTWECWHVIVRVVVKLLLFAPNLDSCILYSALVRNTAYGVRLMGIVTPRPRRYEDTSPSAL